MLYCCGKYFNSDGEIKYFGKNVEYGFCPICNRLRVFYINKYIPKRKAAEFLENCFNLIPLHAPKNGSKQNMYWLYNQNGTIKDFNGQTVGKAITDPICSVI